MVLTRKTMQDSIISSIIGCLSFLSHDSPVPTNFPKLIPILTIIATITVIT